MIKLITLLGLTIGIAQAAPINSPECQDAITNVAILFAVTRNNFDNPDVPAGEKVTLMNTLTQETLKQLNPYSQVNVMQIAGISSAMQTRLFNTLPDIQMVAVNKCDSTKQKILDLAVEKINKDNKKIRQAGYKFLQIFVPHYLKDYGYIQ
jgi:hypothetical protein